MRRLLSAYTVTSLLDDGGAGTLRSIIETANSDPAAVISFSPALTESGPATINLNGAALELDDTNGTLTINGPTNNPLTIDAQGESSVLTVDAGSTAVINELTITGGSPGVLNNGNLTINESTISGNTSTPYGNGGGVYNNYGSLTLNNSTVTGNSAGNDGGGIYNYWQSAGMSVNDCTITSNTAGGGAGIFSAAAGTITASTVSDNQAYEEGAGICDFSDLTIVDSTISGNACDGIGGGVAGGGQVIACTMYQNSAAQGGAVYSFGDMSITDSTIAINYPAEAGGGIYEGSGSTVTISGSIVAANAGGDLAGGAFTGSHNLISDSTIADLSGSANMFGDPLLSDLGDYGGPTQTMPLRPGSLGLGAGANFDDANGNPITTDQRGLPLPTTYAPDIGAVQSFAAPTTVTASVVSPTEIDLNWSDSGSAATKYDISENISGSWVPYDTVDASQSFYDITGLSPGTSYDFGFTPNDDGCTTAPLTVSATTAAPPIVTASGAAAANEGDPGGYTLTLTSDSTATGANAVTGWNVDWGNGSPIYYSGANVTETVSVPTYWTGFAIVATAETTATSSVPSYPVQADPIYVDFVPIAPTVTATVFSDTGITVNWTDSSQCDSNIVLLRSDDGGTTYNPIMTFPAGSGSYTDTSLTPDTAYTYEAEAVGGLDGEAVSTSPATSSVTTMSSNLSLSVGVGSDGWYSADLTWSYAPTDESGFEIEQKDTSVAENFHSIATPDADTDSLTVNNLVVGDNYIFRIRVDAADGTVSDWVSQTYTLPTLAAPGVDVDEVANSGTNNLVVGWSGVPTGGSVAVQVMGDPWPDAGWTSLVGGDYGNFTANSGYGGIYISPDDQGCLVNAGVSGYSGTYTYRVEGFSTTGQPTAWSEPETGSLSTLAGPTLTPAHTATSVTVSFTGSAPAGQVVTYSIYSVATWPGEATESYTQYYSSPYPGQSVGSSTSTSTITAPISFEMDDLNPGYTYHIVISAAPSSGNWAFSRISITTDGGVLPNSPGNLVATLTDPTTVFLHWQDNSNNETGFDIYRSDDPTFDTDVEEVGTTAADVDQYTDTLPDETTTYYYKVYAVLSTTFSANPATSQPVAGITLQSVAFSGFSTSAAYNYTSNRYPPNPQIVLRDLGSQAAYGPVQWYDANRDGSIDGNSAATSVVYADGTIDGNVEHSWPISYERSVGSSAEYMTAAPTFVFAGTIAPGWEVEGLTNVNGNLGRDIIFGPTVLWQNGTSLTANANADQPLAAVIDTEMMTVQWKVSFDNGKTWTALGIGTSSNRLFVTGGKAAAQFESVLWLGCTGGKGIEPGENEYDHVNNDYAIISGIWNEFSTGGTGPANVKDVENQPLYYYHNWHTQNDTTAQLLHDQDGQCGAWTKFFLDTIIAQGVATNHNATGQSQIFNNDYVTLSSTTPVGGLLINSWNFPAGNGPFTDVAPPPAHPGDGVEPLQASGNGYLWISNSASPGRTAPGQNDSTPPSLFGNHQFASIDGVIYDPSYGIRAASLLAYERQAIAATFSETPNAAGDRVYTISTLPALRALRSAYPH